MRKVLFALLASTSLATAADLPLKAPVFAPLASATCTTAGCTGWQVGFDVGETRALELTF